jgi:hypothetical protein
LHLQAVPQVPVETLGTSKHMSNAKLTATRMAAAFNATLTVLPAIHVLVIKPTQS